MNNNLLDYGKLIGKNKNESKNKSKSDYYLKLKGQDLINLINTILSRNIIDEMLDDGYIPKIYNACHGGFGTSDQMITLISILETEFHNTDKFNKFGNMKQTFFDNFISAKLILYLGDEANDEYSKLAFDFIKIECYSSIDTKEYDGLEYLKFNRNNYIVKQVREIMKETINENRKIIKIENLLNKDIIDPILYVEDLENRKIKNVDPYLSICETHVEKVPEVKLDNFKPVGKNRKAK